MGDRSAPARGRPRSEAAHRRILQAAVEEIAAVGVDAFSVANCARRAYVSKGTIYLRWPNAHELMVDALASVATWPRVADLGGLRAELEAVAGAIADRDWWHDLQMLMRFVGEAERHPRLFQEYEQRTVVVGARNVREVFDRAIARGELPPEVDPGALALAFVGGIMIGQELLQTSGHELPTSPMAIIDTVMVLAVKTH
ncbi:MULTISPECIES: TetR/AcrR family transcriptional regulator [unclassified Frankia]|uniref:TetR/AcrR family transcriptional regulator n=1 Tax=unclassified Frankia TaxID=2632575 RepID=UPI002AD35A9C|nr:MULTISPECIES: TetR/AcrR family transcriptional regulator [unclassified Frankia]